MDEGTLMNYDSNLPGNQGNTKLSEIAVDRTLPLFPTGIAQENALTTMQVAFQALTELARRQNYFLRSEGQIQWDGTNIRFDAGALVNSMDLEILSSEGVTNHAFTLRLQGDLSVNGNSTFVNIPMSDGDLLYLELDATLFVNLGTTFNLDNAVSGTGTTAGRRVLKQPMSTAMPQLAIAATKGGSLFYIPLALCRGTDILWIPHGIRWPINTTSTLGAIIVAGFSAYPEQFAGNQAQLLTGLSNLATNGGVLLITQSINLTQSISIPDSVKILGRGLDKNALNLLPGATLLMGNRCVIEGVQITTTASWTGVAINLTGTRSRILDTRIDVSLSVNSSSATCVTVNGSRNRIKDCIFNGVASPSARIGINYVSGSDNADIDCEET